MSVSNGLRCLKPLSSQITERSEGNLSFSASIKTLINLYRKAFIEAGYPLEHLKVGLHIPGYLSNPTEQAKVEYHPVYQASRQKWVKKEDGLP